MNTKTLKGKKETSKISDDTGVFVLSPHMLQQLGINLESIDCAPNHPTILDGNVECAIKQSNHSESGNGKSNESSILETASLIKNTVLLSPTFIPTVGNTIPGEVEIANKKKEFENIDICEKNNNTGNTSKNVLPLKIKESYIDKNIIKQAGDTLTYQNNSLSDLTQTSNNDNNKSDTQNQYTTNKNTELAKKTLQRNSNCLERKNVQHDKVCNSDLELYISSKTVIHTPISNVTSSDSHKNKSLERTTEMSNEILLDNIVSSHCSNLKLNGSLMTMNHTSQSNVTYDSDFQKNIPDKINIISDKNNDNTSKFEEFESLASSSMAINSMMSSSKSNKVNNSNTHEIQEKTNKEIIDVAVSSLYPNRKTNAGDNARKITEGEKCYSDTSSTVEGIFTLGVYGNAQQNNESVCHRKTPELNKTHTDNILVKTINNNGNTSARDKPKRKHLKNNDIGKNHGNSNIRDDTKKIPNAAKKNDQLNNLREDIRTPGLITGKEMDHCSNKVIDEEYKSSKHFNIGNEICITKYVSDGCKEDSLDIVNSHNIVAEQKQKHGVMKNPNPYNNSLMPVNSSVGELIKSSDNTNNPVEEIAEYLSMFVNLNPNRKKLLKERNNSKSLQTKPKENITESKLCIQGVEKPGGLQKTNEHNVLPMTLKTYKRNKQKQTIFSIGQLENKKILNVTIEAQHEDDIDTINLSDTFKTKEFCVCEDFGRLNYYNSNTIYEHIHFCKHTKIDCNPDIILGIYDDNLSCEAHTTIFDNKWLKETRFDSYQDNNCWNDLEGGEHLKYMNVDVSEHKMKPIHIHSKEKFDQYNLSCDNFVECENVEMKLNLVTSPGKTELDVGSRNTSERNKKTVSEANTDIINKIVTNKILPRQAEIIVDTETYKENNNFKTVTDVNEEMHNKNSSNQQWLLKQTEINCSNEAGNEINEQSQDNLAMKHVSPKRTEIVKDISDKKKNKNLGSCLEIKNTNNLPLETREFIESGSPSEYIDNGKTSAFVTEDVEINIDSKINDDTKNNDCHNKTQCKTRKSAITKDIMKSSTKKADQKITVPKQIENSDIQEKGKIAKKRKSESGRGSTNNDSTPDSQCKKNIKCGVCDQLQSEAEWEDHIENEHCFIAWRADQTINLKDAELFQKLKQKLKVHGKLKCTFCGNKNKFLKNFLLHVQKCIETKISSEESFVKCGVCKKELKESGWIKHTAEHNYVAWKDTDTPIVLKDDDLKEYLMKICKENGGLVCYRCGSNRKYVKSYMEHIKTCVGKIDTSTSNTDMNITNVDMNDEGSECRSSTGDVIVKCGVCQDNVKESSWINHMGNKHDYLAWIDGTPPLNIKDDLEVHKHLYHISKQNGGLKCSKCGLIRKYVKTYLHHIQICGEYTTSLEEVSVTELVDEALSTIFKKSIFDVIDDNPQKTVVCGVCHEEVQSSDWIAHIQSQHNYKAWIQGQPVLDVADVVMVRKYLNIISKRMNGLICQTCGSKLNNARTYLTHIEKCRNNLKNYHENAAGSSVQYKVEIDISPTPSSHQDKILSAKVTSSKDNDLQCAICFINVKPREWVNHAMKMHYNLAWPVGGTPIDLKKPYVVEKYLKIYKSQNKLVCKVCGISRASCVGFYAHILVCGKTEEEVDEYKENCEICNNSYLCIYKSQHMTAHREQEYAKERRLKYEEEQAKKKTEETESPSGRRKAAEKAKNVIEKYNTNMKEASHTCPSCNFGMDSKEELANHKCVGKYLGYSSDSDVSVKLEQCSDDDDDDVNDDELIETDDDISNEEEEVVENKKKRHRESLPPPHKKPRIQFNISDPDSYLQESSKDFYETHFTSEVLFNEWRNCQYESVPESELGQYLPPLEKSCKIKFGTDSWTTYERFEARHQKGWCLFAGACIQCVCWAPPQLDDAVDSCGHYLAVACHSHSDGDVPRYNYDQIAQHTNAIQIWNIGDFKWSLPKFVFGISHDYGTVWSMDWCPSGARDLVPPTDKKTEVELRLGLLAIACSNGYAYIFSVPYPSTMSKKDDDVFFKLEPVVELRLTMNANRKIYQATSICWSPQKGHANVIVGYADGTTAFYDLNCDSPILSCKVKNTRILYPYEDKRPQNSCITDVGVYPSACASVGGVYSGAVCSASMGGAGARAGRGGRALHAHVAATRALFAPHWPSVLFAGEEHIVNMCVNEVELCGAGRRLGTACAWAASARAARLCAHAPPLLRTMRTHPAYRDLPKPVIGLLQMIPIDRKRKRKKENDELAVTLEPTTYEAAIQKYGIEYTIINQKDKAEQQKALATAKERWVERFPLSDVSSMAFCHSEKHQNKLAVALHAGLIFILKV